MKRTSTHLVRIAFLGTACVSGALVFGQTQPAGSTRGRSDGASALGQPANNNTAAQVGAYIERSGGSLWAAQVASHATAAGPDPGQVKLSQVSFFSVPEQKPKTLRKHDLVTIIVREESDIQSKGTTDLQKNAQIQAQVNQMVKLKLSNLAIQGLPTPAVSPGVDLSGNRTFKGQAEVDRTDTMTARITAQVVDVKPNGTLVVQATKHIKTDDEEQLFILNGICRVEDVTADNTILSTQLGNLEFQKNHKGAIRATTERGIMPKLLDFINPF